MEDIVNLKEALVKTKSELRMARRSSNLASSKLDFARKVTEQRMSNCLSDQSADMEEELVSLYSTLLDEESFTLEGNEIVPAEDFLKVVEDKVSDIPREMEKLKDVKNKILEKVRQNKTKRLETVLVVFVLQVARELYVKTLT